MTSKHVGVVVGIRGGPAPMKRYAVANVNLDGTVADFRKLACQAITDNVLSEFDLIYAGQVLEGAHILSAYGIRSGVMIHLIARLPSKVEQPVPITDAPIKSISSFIRSTLRLKTHLSPSEYATTFASLTVAAQRDPIPLVFVQDSNLFALLERPAVLKYLAIQHPTIVEIGMAVATQLTKRVGKTPKHHHHHFHHHHHHHHRHHHHHGATSSNTASGTTSGQPHVHHAGGNSSVAIPSHSSSSGGNSSATTPTFHAQDDGSTSGGTLGPSASDTVSNGALAAASRFSMTWEMASDQTDEDDDSGELEADRDEDMIDDVVRLGGAIPWIVRSPGITPAQLASALDNAGGGTIRSNRAGTSVITPEMCNTAIQQAISQLPTGSAGSAHGASTSTAAFPAAETVETLRSRFRGQLMQMREMGLRNESLNIRALQATVGDVQAAIELVFNGVVE